MDISSIIPDYQPIPFPAPVWLLKLLLVLGFYLHALPMNVALTGGIMAALFILLGHAKKHAYAQRIGGSLAYSLPFFVSVAITQGIVPLLFLQLVYGPLFYTSSIVMALPWLSVIFFILIAYYAYYLFTYRRKTLDRQGPWVLIAAGLLFLTVAFIFSNNMTLMLTPERWVELYRSNSYGVNLNLEAAQLIPRYLHFVVAAFAITALTIGCFGLYWHSRDKQYGEWLIRTGASIFILLTLLQAPIGLWFLFSLKTSVAYAFLGADFTGTAVFTAAMILDIIGLGAMALAWRTAKPLYFIAGLASALIVTLLMVIMRHLVRVYYIEGFIFPERMAVDTQWLLLMLFIGSFIIGLVYTGWLIKITWQAYHSPVTPST